MKRFIILVLATAGAASFVPCAASAQAPSVESIYADLANLAPGERQKRIEEGARREGNLVIIHTMRGHESTDHLALFGKRFPYLKIALEGDIGSQDAAERLYAEETAGRHFTDVINVALPDLTTLLARG